MGLGVSVLSIQGIDYKPVKELPGHLVPKINFPKVSVLSIQGIDYKRDRRLCSMLIPQWRLCPFNSRNRL